MKKRILVILSGGLDSTVLAYHLASQPDIQLVGAVSVDYRQRHRYEILCAHRTADKLNIPHMVLDIPSMREFMPTSALTSMLPVPKGHYAADSMRATVVPNRNMILIALATGVAISLRADGIAYGAHSGDHAIYPDCRPEFADALANTIALCDENPPQLWRPFIEWSKADIVHRGLFLGVPWEDTWTCYEGVEPGHYPSACGTCGTCVERLEAFAKCGAVDPIPYRDSTSFEAILDTFAEEKK